MSNQKQSILDTTIQFKSIKGQKTEEVRFGDLPLASQQAILRYGAGRFINDKTGGSDKTREDAAKIFDDTIQQLRDGWIDRRGSGGSGPVDPVEKEARKLAQDRVRAAIKAKGYAMKQFPKEKISGLVDQMLEKHGKDLREKAKQIVEMQSSTLDADLDLSSLVDDDAAPDSEE